MFAYEMTREETDRGEARYELTNEYTSSSRSTSKKAVVGVSPAFLIPQEEGKRD